MAKILLVDDDVELTELLAEVLNIEGFDVELAYNGEEALKLLNFSHDIVLLDVMMPVLNGIETLKQIRKSFSTPVLMLTARGDDIDRVLGLELGADDYLSKPFNDRELVARIKAILRRTQNQSTALSSSSNIEKDDNKHLEFGGITLYPGRQQALYLERDLDLTGTEFALLQILIKHPGQILSRELLSLEILGKRLTPFDRAIDMHISNLRKKLPERADNLPWFKTLRGRGYLLVTEK
ncbi:envelope stress response regulator transcription factor CpxR [Testudinibacter sp. TR-2022]|uniref:envelope stress response regulator transcription factor CpxR n=1 Tax=Testudinibacter sp. TR-2022 TaxID=2585029 RepID=UPI0011191CA3|nr:envelope stress response regulator transcription factor CpxR [Testudinibacter sp. TR-2022]TNG95289.1 envelope stress response regulator transcription factor CpxR [Pasteurellaceae bacterium USgator41]TNG95756.1 envelope stress response regulator transcription factor CpxR [Pasteurellaceae bacterium UScroc31]TNG96033.1 envelope stress response regulator transcription factor CpxR [Pasteurellaceae bacterium UScroc12]TNH03183.1 envelope stress response regulator transcription factor CpxR [Pasteure